MFFVLNIRFKTDCNLQISFNSLTAVFIAIVLAKYSRSKLFISIATALKQSVFGVSKI